MTYFAAHHLGTGCSVMVTGSHNPPDYNGLKMVVAGDDAVRRRHPGPARAHRSAATRDAAPARYRDARHRDRPTSSASSATCKLARPLKIAVDCGNGVAGRVRARRSTARMGCEVVELFCEVDGTFPTTIPIRRKPENLAT